MKKRTAQTATAAAEQKPAKLTYTLLEAAGLLGISYSTAWKFTKTGQLRCIRNCRHRVIPATEVQRFLTQELEAV